MLATASRCARPLDAKTPVGCEVADRTSFRAAPDFSDFPAVAAQDHRLVLLLHRFDELGETCLRLVHVDGDHIS